MKNTHPHLHRVLSGTLERLEPCARKRARTVLRGGWGGNAPSLLCALGRRVSRTNGGTTTSFLFDGGAVVAQNVSGTYQMPTTFGNQPIRSGSELPIYDAQGNQRAVTASNQTVTGTQVFDAFGNKVAATGSTASALQWQGTSLYRTYAPDAGLLQAGARYYDAQVGRFTTRDTVLSQPAYIYCGGDPINCGDPSGRDITPRLRHWIYSGLGIIATIGLGAAGVGSTLTSPAWVPITIGVCTVLAVISLIGLSAEGDPGGPWFPPAPNVPNGPPDPNDPYGGHSPGTGHRQTGGGVNYD